VWPLHERLSFAQGAAIGVPYFTAYRSLFLKCHARPGETVLVHGASGAVGKSKLTHMHPLFTAQVGIACVQIAHSIGMTVIGTAGTEDGLAIVKQQGADHVFNHREEGYEKKIMVPYI
jgi:NADPH2:quinone reductase